MQEEKGVSDMTAMDEKNLNEVNGGSWVISEEEGKAAGLTLVNDDGTPGSWGTLWNSGNYKFQGKELAQYEAVAVVRFYNRKGRQPETLEEALEYTG